MGEEARGWERKREGERGLSSAPPFPYPCYGAYEDYEEGAAADAVEPCERTCYLACLCHGHFVWYAVALDYAYGVAEAAVTVFDGDVAKVDCVARAVCLAISEDVDGVVTEGGEVDRVGVNVADCLADCLTLDSAPDEGAEKEEDEDCEKGAGKGNGQGKDADDAATDGCQKGDEMMCHGRNGFEGFEGVEGFEGFEGFEGLEGLAMRSVPTCIPPLSAG